MDAAGRQLATSGARSRWVVLGLAGVALLMTSVDQMIVATALTAIGHGIHSGIKWTSWVITGYALGQIVAMPLAGRLSESYACKQVFLAATTLFTITSIGCALATSGDVLIPMRIAQGLGGGSILPSVTAIVAAQFGGNRDRALGILTSIFPLGSVIGPVLGGAFVSYWSWRGIFP